MDKSAGQEFGGGVLRYPTVSTNEVTCKGDVDKSKAKDHYLVFDIPVFTILCLKPKFINMDML